MSFIHHLFDAQLTAFQNIEAVNYHLMEQVMKEHKKTTVYDWPT